MTEVISQDSIDRRLFWIDEIITLRDDFGSDSSRVEEELAKEIEQNADAAILDHLRLCSAIPESYGHNSSEEKLYSKYTDALISAVYSYIGLESTVLTERADSADVRASSDDYSFVADAKAFRLSRTSKNQKDFKVEAMNNWKRGDPFAMIVCPLYQLPSRSSQIYLQATTQNVCIFSYTHLAVLTRLSKSEGTDITVSLLHEIFRTVQGLNPSKDASIYWQAVNQAMLQYGGPTEKFWQTERIAIAESIKISKEIALKNYSDQREVITKMSRKDAIRKLIEVYKIDSRINTITSVLDNRIMEIS